MDQKRIIVDLVDQKKMVHVPHVENSINSTSNVYM